MQRGLLQSWASVWGVSDIALADLMAQLRVDIEHLASDPSARSEAAVQMAVRVEGRDKGVLMMRNNCGALTDKDGRLVRYGLANDSKTVNSQMKSADLIGIRPILVGAEHIGRTIGQFVSRECKAPGWKFIPSDERAQAQMRWAALITSLGGDAMITDRVGTL
jgi:hypothetical protein